ncbi:MAG: protein translocase subunit SecF [Candidatus Bipolaricaulota bacterium]
MRHLDFLGKAKYFVTISAILVAGSAVLLVPGIRGLNLGIDFTGGMEFTVKLSESVDTAVVRNLLGTVDAGAVDLRTSKIQSTAGNTKIITTKLLDVEEDALTINRVEEALREQLPVEDISRRLIGEQVSRELAQRSWLAIGVAMLGVLIYVSWRFRLRYAIGAVAALFHDVMVTLGIFALFRLEISLETIAAFLTLVGYSLNDTIVIFDRVRENLKVERRLSMFDLINLSVNQSLVRTINTASTTLIPIVVTLFFGGVELRTFALALFIGMLLGTYSTLYIANPILYAWTLRAERAKRS